MASWSTKRRFGYFLAFAAFVLLAVALPLFLFFYEKPACSDGKQNGGEKGIDCGGVCARLCPADYLPPRVLWSFSMQIAPGLYNALAYVENPNQTVQTDSAYSFKLYDSKGLLVAEKKGRTAVPVGQKFAVFAGGIKTGERIPARTVFELADSFEWRKGAFLTGLDVLFIEVEQGEKPKAEARISNGTADRVYSSIDVFIILYDEDDNRTAFSKTLIEKINPGETKTVYFTWPSSFTKNVVRSEILFVPN